jgi:hypothetical protein
MHPESLVDRRDHVQHAFRIAIEYDNLVASPMKIVDAVEKLIWKYRALLCE